MDKPLTQMRGEEMYKIGLRYETCNGCGRIWNVSRCAQRGIRYLCPVCRARLKEELA